MIRTFIYIILTSSIVLAQERDIYDSLDIYEGNNLENIIEQNLEEDNNSTIDDELRQFEEEPIDLNKATIDELRVIPFINKKIASNIIKRRKKTKFSSIDELLFIEGITPQHYALLSKYVTIRSVHTKQKNKVSFLSRMKTEIEKRRGYIDGTYLGSPLKTVNKFRISICEDAGNSFFISNIKVGGLIEKDPGEKDFTNHSTGYVSFKLLPLNSKIIIGDYQIETGEGVVFGGANKISKAGVIITNSLKNRNTVYTSLSADENNYFRGAAMSMQSGDINLQMFYSNKYINATLDKKGLITSIDKSGLFRTESEIRKKGSSKEKMIGYNLQANIINNLRIGSSGYRTAFNNSCLVDKELLSYYSVFQVNGINITYNNKEYELFSEIAIDKNMATAKNAGVIFSPQKYISFIAIIRDYAENFQSQYSNAFGEKWDRVQNETGFFLGARSSIDKRLWLTFYYDQYSYPKESKILPIISNGNELLISSEYRLLKNYNIELRYRSKKKTLCYEDLDIHGRKMMHAGQRVQRNYRLTGKLNLLDIQLQNRIEWIKVTQDLHKREKGLLLSQTLKYSLTKSIKMICRATVFDTDSYESRIYNYEDDLPGVFTNSTLYGKGLHWYLILRINLHSKFYFASKYSQTIKDGVRFIGSGKDVIIGDRLSVLSAQIEVKL